MDLKTQRRLKHYRATFGLLEKPQPLPPIKKQQSFMSLAFSNPLELQRALSQKQSPTFKALNSDGTIKVSRLGSVEVEESDGAIMEKPNLDEYEESSVTQTSRYSGSQSRKSSASSVSSRKSRSSVKSKSLRGARQSKTGRLAKVQEKDKQKVQKKRKRRPGNFEQSQHKSIEKKTRLYPDIAESKKRNLYFAEFVARGEGDPSLRNVKFDPTELEYQYPDFGFDNPVSYNDGAIGWSVFLDYINLGQKFQRAHNYVKYCSERKEELLSAMGIRGDKKSSSPDRVGQNLLLQIGGNNEKMKVVLAQRQQQQNRERREKLMSKEERFFHMIRDEITNKLEKNLNDSKSLSSHVKSKQEEMRRLETIEERREKASLATIMSKNKKAKQRYNSTTRSSVPSISSLPDNHQASRYLTQSVDSMTIAQMTSQIKDECGYGPRRIEKVGKYFEVIGNPQAIAKEEETIGEMSFQAAGMTVEHTTEETLEAVKNLRKQIQKRKGKSRQLTVEQMAMKHYEKQHYNRLRLERLQSEMDLSKNRQDDTGYSNRSQGVIESSKHKLQQQPSKQVDSVDSQQLMEAQDYKKQSALPSQELQNIMQEIQSRDLRNISNLSTQKSQTSIPKSLRDSQSIDLLNGIISEEQEALRRKIIQKLQTAILKAQRLNEELKVPGEDFQQAKRALDMLTTGRISELDASNHLNILINTSLFSPAQISTNAQLVLKFVLQSKRISKQSASALRFSELEPIRPLVWSKLPPQTTKNRRNNLHMIKADSMQAQRSGVISRIDANRERIARTYKYKRNGRSQQISRTKTERRFSPERDMSLGIYTKSTKRDYILPQILHQSQDRLRKMAQEEQDAQDRELKRLKELSDAQYRSGIEAEVPTRYKKNFEKRIGSIKTLKTMRCEKDPGRATGLNINVDLFEEKGQSEDRQLVSPNATTLYSNQYKNAV